MSDTDVEANIALLRRAFDTLGRGDIAACQQMLTDDFLINLAEMPYQKRGRKAWGEHAGLLRAAFPDVKVVIDDIFGAGDKVAVRVTISGTHRGEFLGNAPSGKPISYKSHEIYRFTDGRIAEEWICSDMLTLMTQVGAFSSGRLVSMWLAGYRLWLGLAVGLAVGLAAGALLL